VESGIRAGKADAAIDKPGKTTLILQAIGRLLEEGVRPEEIGYFSGVRGDSFNDLHSEQARKELQFVFIDETSSYKSSLSCWKLPW